MAKKAQMEDFCRVDRASLTGDYGQYISNCPISIKRVFCHRRSMFVVVSPEQAIFCPSVSTRLVGSLVLGAIP